MIEYLWLNIKAEHLRKIQNLWKAFTDTLKWSCELFLGVIIKLVYIVPIHKLFHWSLHALSEILYHLQVELLVIAQYASQILVIKLILKEYSLIGIIITIIIILLKYWSLWSFFSVSFIILVL